MEVTMEVTTEVTMEVTGVAQRLLMVMQDDMKRGAAASRPPV